MEVQKNTKPYVGRLIGFAGSARHGKTTAAESIKSHRGKMIMSFANPLKGMVYNLVYSIHGVETAFIMNQRDEVIPILGKTPRELWQSLGTEWGRGMVHPDLWVFTSMPTCMDLLVNNRMDVVFDDVRFQNEVDAINAAGGEVHYIERPGMDMGYTHSSEIQELTGLTSVITNDSTLDLFKKKISNIFKP